MGLMARLEKAQAEQTQPQTNGYTGPLAPWARAQQEATRRINAGELPRTGAKDLTR